MIPGTVIEGRFELEREAGTGGMSVVYLARDRLDASPLAIKFLRGEDATGVERFEREAAVLAELHHPGIVRYVANGATPTGEHYIVMEWLEGEDLAHRLARARLTLADCLTILHRTASALVPAHQRGVLHRDLKPSNIFLVDGDIARVKLLDFGIARLVDESQRLTLSGVLMGTPGYMAPEQVQGTAVHDPRTDVFSLGCVFWECLTGRPAFEGVHAMAVLAKILLQDVPPLRKLQPEVPESVERLVGRMLAKDPTARPQDAAEVVAELDALMGDIEGMVPAPLERVATARLQSTSTLSTGAYMQAALTLSEQRLVSVVLAGAPDAEDSTATRRLKAPEVEHYGGQLNVLADGSMLVTIWGAGSIVDRVERAARCALALRARYNEIPICVVTGRGVVSARSVEGKVIDRGVNALHATEQGVIRLDGATSGMLGPRFITEPQADAFLLSGERPARESTPLLLGKPTSCIGRARELSMLEAVFTSCVEEPLASAALVTGPAGAGKSRLRREFLKRVELRGEPVEILSGRADSLAESSPFGILVDAIRGAAGIQDGEPLEARRQKLARRIHRHVDPASQLRVTAFLGEMTCTPFPDDDDAALRAARENPQLMGDAMRAAWEDWLAAECAIQPMVLVLEDLHWGDAATVRLLDSTLRNLRNLPFMVLVLARPEVQTRFPALWVERDVQLIKLGPLPRKASEQLVREALGKAARDETVARIIERADGNPFFLEELVRAVAAGRGDVFPDSMLGTVEARLDAEGLEAKRILRASSVFGERFSMRGVAALLGGEHHLEQADAWLEILASRELVTRASTPELVDDDGYVFRHALVREAAYAMLTETDRILGHRLAGEWLEQTGHTDATSLAEHFRRGAEPARAGRWYRRAAEQALEADELDAALERAERGVACGACGEELGALRLVQAEAHVWRGEFAQAEQRGLDAQGLLKPGSAAWFRVLTRVVSAAGKLGAFDRVQTWVGPVGDAIPELEAMSAQVICLSECATYLIFGGRYAEADALLASSADRVRALPAADVKAIVAFEQVRAIRAMAAADLGAGLAGFEAALVASARADDRRSTCVIRANLGFVFAELGDFKGAEDSLRAALAAAERMGLHDLSMVAAHNLGHVLAYRGQIPEARSLEQGAVETFMKMGERRLEGLARTYLAKIELLAQDFAAAEREARGAAEVLVGVPPLRAAAVAVLARALLAQGRVEEALGAAREAFSLLEELVTIEEGEALVRLAYAEALAATGKQAEFLASIAEARAKLLERAAKISDPSWRERFLASVPDNALTLALASPERPMSGR